MRDESRDGIVDLGGNLTEITLDTWAALSDAGDCWPQRALLQDPVCRQDSPVTVGRGGNWAGGMALAQSALRAKVYSALGNVTQGFRCVYEDTP